MELVIASNNLHKIREFRDFLKEIEWIDVLSLLDFPEYQPPEEKGDSFEEIVKEKAIHAANALDRLVLADDSGLVVPVLKDRPGIYSRRYAGEDVTDRENREKLLQELEGKEGLDRSAYFVCSVAIANSEGLLKCITGRCEGEVTTEERGRNGFGYDPVFQKHDYDKTFAEIDEAVKNRISHRRKAFEKIAVFLEHFRKETINSEA